MKFKETFKSILSTVLALTFILSAVPITTTFAAQSNEYVDPADVWMSANGRTNEFDMNATITYETQYCTVCGRDTVNMTYRVPEYTKTGETALNRSVRYSDGTCIDGVSNGNLDSGMPGQDAYYTGYHFTKSVCQTCGTINSVDGPGDYDFNKNVYCLNPCDHNFFLDFDNTTYEPYDEHYHNTTLKAGKYCQFCKGTKERGTVKHEAHDFHEVVDAQLGNNRFYIYEHCDDCGYETSEYVTAKSVISSYYGNVDGEAHTLTVSDLSDKGVKTSIRYGTSADNCNLTSAPNYTQAGYNTVYYKITYTYDGESMTENGVSYVWLLDEPETNITVIVPDMPNNDKHEHDYRYIETVPPTCDTLGYERWQCAECGALEKKNYVPMTGHNYETVIIREATCKQGGLTLHLCKSCGDFYTETTPMGAHNYHAKNVNPTCQSVGYTEHICEFCGDTYITDIQPIVSHAFERITKIPTCTDKGYTNSTCAICGLSYVSDYTDKVAHNYETVVTEPTCTAMGFTTYTCKDCGNSYVADYTDMLGHTLSDWIIDEATTIDHNGKKHIECTVCGEVLSSADIAQLADTDRTDEDGNAEVGKYAVLVTDKNGIPVFNSEIIIDVNDNITIKLPGERLLDYADQTIVTVMNTETNTGVSDIRIFIFDNNNNAATGITNADGQVRFPNNQSSTGDDNGTIGKDNEEAKETFVVRVTDKLNTIIPDCDIYLGESNNIVVDLPDGVRPSREEPVIIIVTDQNGVAQKDVTIIAIGDDDYIEKGKTDIYGRVTIPITDKGYTDDNGKVSVEQLNVIVNDETELIPNVYVVHGEDGTISVILPEGKSISYDNRITVTVLDSMGNAVPNISVTVSDKAEKTYTADTDENGKFVTPPLNEDITDNDGNSGVSETTTQDGKDTDGDGEVDTPAETVTTSYKVTVSDTTGIIPNALVKIEDGKVYVTLPDGKTLTTSNQTTVTVLDKEDKPVKDVSVTVTDSNKATATKTTDANGKITVPVKTSSGGGGGSRSGGGSVSVNTTNIKITDKDGKNVTGFTKSTDKDGNVTITLPSGKTMTDKDYYTITVTNGSGAAKSDITVTLKDKSDNSASGITDKNGVVILPGEEHKAYIFGYDDGTFRPESDMTRAEAAAIFARLVSDKKGEKISGNSTFADVSSKDWFAKEVGYLEKYNIIKGYEDNTFKPDAAVTRAEFVTMAVRYYSLFNEVKKTGYTVNYTDLNSSYWVYGDIAYAKNIGWLNGYADGTFKGDNNITRAEVVTVVNCATGRNADESYINKNLSVLNKFTDLKNNSHWAYYDIEESANTHRAVNSSEGEAWVK